MYRGQGVVLQEFLFQGTITRGVRNGQPKVGSRGVAPVWSLGDEVSEKLKQFADILYGFDCKTIKI